MNEALKSYSHVNKKAFEQYASFTKQRDTLTQRRSELDSSHKSIEDLIGVLDQRKDEAIERTFKQVSKEFANVFEKLVPAGKGRLIIQRKSDRNEQNVEDDSDQERRESVENYIGVGISVSFNSKHDDQQRIQQLSGGQKSMCKTLVYALNYQSTSLSTSFFQDVEEGFADHLKKVYALLRSFLQSSNVIQPHSIFSTKLTPTWAPNIELQ